MLKRIFSTALVLSVLPATAAALPDGNQIEFSNCTLTLPGTHLTANARCGFFDVAVGFFERRGRGMNRVADDKKKTIAQRGPANPLRNIQ